MQQIPLGPATPILQGVTYALPGRAVIIASDAPLEVSITGINWIALPTSGRTVAAFVRCPSSNTIITCKGLPRSVGGSALTYAQLVAADGASHYWPLDEPSGVAAVDTIGGFNGVISGGVTLNQSPAITSGKSMLFDGSTGKIALVSLDFPLNCSVEAWIKTTFIGASQPVITNWFASGSGIYIGTNLGNLFVFVSGAANGPAVADGNWHHVVYVIQGTNVTVYLDTVSSSAGACGHAGTIVTVGTIANGAPGLSADFWHGSLDEIAIYPLVLTPAQIAAHYAFKAGAVVTSNLLIETGDTLLLETGDRLALQ